jgi:ATP-dependent helicase/nuclease subunit A
VELLKLQERLLWKYPFSAATVESAVKRVSTLIWEQAEALDESQLLFNYDPSPGARSPAAVRKRPASTMAAVDIGSAHHRFLEMVSLERVSELAELKQEAAQMLSEGNLKQNEVEALDFNALREFWRSEIGKRILSQAPNVHREIPFTARFSPEDFATLNLCSNAADLAGEYFVVRGQADLAVLLPREIWLLDFKTDQVTEPDSDEKARQYAPQLKLYALGLSRIYRRPVTHRWLHFLALGKTVSV